MLNPKCGSCDTPIVGMFGGGIDYRKEDISLSYQGAGFVDVFSCKKCGAVFNVQHHVAEKKIKE